MKAYTVPEDLLFYPAQVDGWFWARMSNLLVWLASPEELARLYTENPKEYFEIIEPFKHFIAVTETNLKEQGKLIEKEIGE